MPISDNPPPNVPRALVDGELLLERQRVPVLISGGNRRMIVLQSHALAELRPGQPITVQIGEREEHYAIIDVDKLAMVVTYTTHTNDDDIPDLPDVGD